MILDPADRNYYSKTMIAGMFFNLRGTPFIYQGEEIGMENFKRTSIEQFDDIGSRGQYERAIEEGYTKEEALHFLNLRSRDNTRTPMQWDNSEYAGFSDTKPWILMAGNQDQFNVENQIHDPKSVYSFYKRMIAVRKQEDTLVYGDFEGLENYPDDVIAYKRIYNGETITCLCNFSHDPQPIEKVTGNVLLNNYENYTDGILQPFQFVMIKD